MATNADLHLMLGRIEGKVDTFIAQMKVQDERSGGLEGRVRKVEARQHWYSGAGAAVGMLFGFFAKQHT